MSHPPKFVRSKKTLELEEKVTLALGEYLRALNHDRIEQGHYDADGDEPQEIDPEYFLTNWAVVGEFQHPDPDYTPFIIGAHPRGTTTTHATGMANYWY